ncbi:MAG: DoxX family protein [Verrucomicrobium sp.]|nr:DoxX family protein [Verrucomicrobium sp.]
MKKLLHTLTATPALTAPLFLRLSLAVVFFPHGAQKVLGWYGGFGFHNTVGFFTTQMGLPYALAVLPILTEFLAPFALLFGFFTRLAALALFVNMFVAMTLVHWQNGFFMNWMNAQKGEGIEYFLLVFGLTLALVIQGAGRFSLDKVIGEKTA